MIVIGYQGIGKSTLAGRERRFIDLESSNFWINGARAYDWYKPYCKIAEHLSSQGYIVFTSSHEVVRKELLDTKKNLVVCFPSLELKEDWINKLEKRYKQTQLEKDYKAFMNAKDRYEENIKELERYCDLSPRIIKMKITNLSYDLEASIIHLLNTMTI